MNSRTKVIKYQLATEAEQEARKATEKATEEARKATEEARRVAIQDAQLRAQLENVLVEFGGNELKAQIFIRLREVISEQLSVEKSQITLDSHISKDLNADECDTIELAMVLLAEFEVEIPDDMLGSAKVWPPSYSGNTFGDYFAVACTVRELLLFIHEKIYAA